MGGSCPTGSASAAPTNRGSVDFMSGLRFSTAMKWTFLGRLRIMLGNLDALTRNRSDTRKPMDRQRAL